MLCNDSVLPQLSRVEKAAFHAELLFLSNIPKNENWEGNSYDISRSLNFASVLLDDFLVNVFPKAPDATFLGLFETLSQHAYSIGVLLMDSKKTDEEKEAEILDFRDKSFEKINSILNCLPISNQACLKASIFIISTYDATTKELLRDLSGRVSWDDYAWRCLAPAEERLH